jgi:2-polyprenyl-6-methoxyphenol hydroxylase-like FAD-dependent oxidoreductase
VMSAELRTLRRDGDHVTGVDYLDRDTGELHELSADLVVGCDGRHSTVRDQLQLPGRVLGSPFDCLYVRMPRQDSHPANTVIRFSSLGGLVLIHRGYYWQAAILIPQGAAATTLADDARSARETIRTLAPYLTEEAAALDASKIATLETRLDRLKRWWAPGALCIGDAAHAMSPIAAVGVNLAIQDAVATANLVGPALRRGHVTGRELAAVQRRRTPPTVFTQALQRSAQKKFYVHPETGRPPLRVPQPLRTLRHLPFFPHLLGRLVGIGLRPEHVKSPAR